MIEERVIDETFINVEIDYVSRWTTIEPENNQILALTISIKRNMLIAEEFISGLARILV
jgi:putative transposase